jgi:two-component system sensor histidine kinase KdpD
VYGEVQAERAAANFFRKGNLMALRELALRRTADRVEDDVQTYRSDRSIDRIWKTEAALLCCIGPDGAEHVVRSAALLAQQLAVSWHAVYVETPALQRLPEARRQRILGAVKLAEELGATTAIIPDGQVATAVVDYARENNLSKLVMGHNRASLWRPAGTLAQQLGRLAADVDLIEIGVLATRSGRPERAAGAALPQDAGRRLKPAGYVVALLACGAGTAIVVPLEGVIATPNIVMLYMLAVVGVALRFGRGPAAFAALVNVLAFDFFLVPPKLSFAVADLQYVITFGVMLAVGLVVGQLTAGLRYQARVAVHRERRSHSLFEVARALSSELVVEQVVETASKAIAREFSRARAHLRPGRRRSPDAGSFGGRLAGSGPGDGPLGLRSSASRRPRHRHDPRQLLALPAAECIDANARCPRPSAGEPASLRPFPSSVASWRPSRRSPPSRSSECTMSKWRSRRPCRSSRSGCAIRCCRRCPTICARRSRG